MREAATAPVMAGHDFDIDQRDAALLAEEAKYCSFGDTVHYSDPPKIFDRCDGSYLFDGHGTPFLDLQMWYSAVNFGYSNKRLNDALDKTDSYTLPQVASQYLASDQDRTRESRRRGREEKMGPRRPRAFQRRRFSVGRRFDEDRAQRDQRKKPDVRVRRRLSRTHIGRVGDHVVVPLSPSLRTFRSRAVHRIPLSLPRPERHVEGGIR